MGSVELIDDYDKLWATILDETNHSVSNDSMITAQDGWNSDQEDRDNSVMEQQSHAINIQAKELLQVPAYDQLVDGVIGTREDCQVSGNNEGNVAGTQWGEERHLIDEGMKEKAIPDKGSNYFTWFNFKLNQCMSAMWINGTQSGDINTLKSWDLIENSSMMEKSSRDTHATKGSSFHEKNHKATSLVSPSLASTSSSLHTATQKELTSLPLLSSSPSLTESSTSTTNTTINPLNLFTAADLELDSLSLHQERKGNKRASSESFPSLSNLSLPTSPVSQHFPEKKALSHTAPKHIPELTPLVCEDSVSQAMEHTEEHTGGSSHNEQGGGASSINLNWAPEPTDWNAKKQALIEQLGLDKYVDTCRDKDEVVALEAIQNYNATTKKT